MLLLLLLLSGSLFGSCVKHPGTGIPGLKASRRSQGRSWSSSKDIWTLGGLLEGAGGLAEEQSWTVPQSCDDRCGARSRIVIVVHLTVGWRRGSREGDGGGHSTFSFEACHSQLHRYVFFGCLIALRVQ